MLGLSWRRETPIASAVRKRPAAFIAATTADNEASRSLVSTWSPSPDSERNRIVRLALKMRGQTRKGVVALCGALTLHRFRGNHRK